MKKRILDNCTKTTELGVLTAPTILHSGSFVFAPNYRVEIKIPASIIVINFNPL
jgi:hypothetical protein